MLGWTRSNAATLKFFAIQTWLVFTAITLVLAQSGDASLPEIGGHNATIYTYFETIPSSLRTTGMSDHDDQTLLEFWKQQWTNVGWTPIVLGPKDIAAATEKLEGYYSEMEKLVDDLRLDPWSRVLFHRWMAMAAIGGGWYADYDVVPLAGLPQDGMELPNNGRITVHDIVSPTLASGMGDEWLTTLRALLQDAMATHQQSSRITTNQSLTFWTDSLGINNLVKDYGKQSPAPLTAKHVLMPYGRNDPVVSQNPLDCQARNIRNRWVVHVSPKALQMAPQHSLDSLDRHPKHRTKLAQTWLEGWRNICAGHKTLNQTAVSSYDIVRSVL